MSRRVTTRGRRRRGPLRRPAGDRDLRRPVPQGWAWSTRAEPGGRHAGRPDQLVSTHVDRRWHQGRRRGAAGEPRHRGDQVRRVLAHRRTPRCWPRRSTRWPTPATRCCCCSAAARSRRAATAEHPFGYGRERYIYSFIVAIVLFSVGGLFALYEAYHKFHEIHAGHSEIGGRLEAVRAASSVLLLAIVLESLSFRTAIRETNKIRGDASYRRVHPAGQAARAPGHPARGLRGAARPARSRSSA